MSDTVSDPLNTADPLHNNSWLSKNVSSIAGLIVLTNFFVFSFLATFDFGIQVHENVFNVVFIGISNVTTGYVTYLWGASKTQKDALKAKLLTTPSGTTVSVASVDDTAVQTTTTINADIPCDVVKQIKNDVVNSVSNADIAAKYSIDVTVIDKIMSGEIYSNC